MPKLKYASKLIIIGKYLGKGSGKVKMTLMESYIDD